MVLCKASAKVYIFDLVSKLGGDINKSEVLVLLRLRWSFCTGEAFYRDHGRSLSKIKVNFLILLGIF